MLDTAPALLRSQYQAGEARQLMPGGGRLAEVPFMAACRAAYGWWEGFAASRAGVWLMFLWALAEAIVWPVIPDFLLAPLAAANRRRFAVPLAAAIAGSTLGGMVAYLVASLLPDHAGTLLRLLPLVSERQISAAQQSLAIWGAAAFLFQPWSGTPLKVWVVVAAGQGMPPWPAIPLFIAARAVRMAGVALGARLLAGRFARIVRDFSLYLGAIYVALFCGGWWLVTR